MKLMFLFSTDSGINCKPQIGSGVSSGSKLLITTNARANLNCKISVKIKILQQLFIMFSFFITAQVVIPRTTECEGFLGAVRQLVRGSRI